MNIFRSEKFQKIFYPIFYLIFTIAITISGCFIFQRYYYTNIFVSGSSMVPTLVGNDTLNIHHYGIADTSEDAINGLERFDVLIANFPDSWGTTKGLVVKRLWGLPGENISLSSTVAVVEGKSVYTSTFTVKHGTETVYTVTAHDVYKEVDLISDHPFKTLFRFDTEKKTFYTNTKELRNFNVTLNANEYFVMGDNWGESSDSYGKSEKLTRQYVKGKVVCIQGYAKVQHDEEGNYTIYDKHHIKAKYIF